MSLLSVDGCESTAVCASSAALVGCCDTLSGLAGAISVVAGGVFSRLSSVVGTRFDGSAAVGLAAADAAASLQVSDAVVSAPDCADTKVLVSRSNSIAASDAPKA